MKTTTITTFTFFLFFLFTFTFSAYNNVVVDTDGDLLKNGSSYHIVPALFGRGGGLGVAATGNETCPLTVAQLPSEVNDGLPLVISSPYRIANIPEGLMVDMAFAEVPVCAVTPSKWTVIEEEPEGMKRVKISGYENAIEGKFKIKKYKDLFYKLVFCPVSGGDGACGDIGIYYDEDGNRHLVIVVDENPFAIVFKKV